MGRRPHGPDILSASLLGVSPTLHPGLYAGAHFVPLVLGLALGIGG